MSDVLDVLNASKVSMSLTSNVYVHGATAILGRMRDLCRCCVREICDSDKSVLWQPCPLTKGAATLGASTSTSREGREQSLLEGHPWTRAAVNNATFLRLEMTRFSTTGVQT